MLYMVLADSALELIPKEIGKHTAVGKNIKRYGNAGRVLDVSQHHSAMTGLKDHASRGRPDIIHHFIIDMLSSVLNKWGLLRIYVHTRNTNKLYEFNPAMRPPKEYWRFKGVIFNLLKDGVIKLAGGEVNMRDAFLSQDKVKSDDIIAQKFASPLKIMEENKKGEFGPQPEFLNLDHFLEYGDFIIARKMKKSLPKFIEFLNPTMVYRMKKTGKLSLLNEVFSKHNPDDHIVCIVGGFQSGFYTDIVEKIKAEDISIFPANLETWTVNQRVLINYENFILEKANKS